MKKKRVEQLKELDVKDLAELIYSTVNNCCDFCVNRHDQYTCSSIECSNNIAEWLEEQELIK